MFFRKLEFLLFISPIQSLECRDQNPGLCVNANCDNKLHRLLCPKTCKLCEGLGLTSGGDCEDQGSLFQCRFFFLT